MRLRTVVEGSPAALTITTSLLRSTAPPRRSGGGGAGAGGDDLEAYVDGAVRWSCLPTSLFPSNRRIFSRPAHLPRRLKRGYPFRVCRPPCRLNFLSPLGPTTNHLKNVDRVERDNAGNPPHLMRIRVSRSKTIGDRSWGRWRNAQRTTRRILKSDQTPATERVTAPASPSNDHGRPSSVPARRPAKITLGGKNYLSCGSLLFRSEATRRVPH